MALAYLSTVVNGAQCRGDLREVRFDNIGTISGTL
jgi:hypothetical protein